MCKDHTKDSENNRKCRPNANICWNIHLLFSSNPERKYKIILTHPQTASTCYVKNKSPAAYFPYASANDEWHQYLQC